MGGREKKSIDRRKKKKRRKRTIERRVKERCVQPLLEFINPRRKKQEVENRGTKFRPERKIFSNSRYILI